MNIDRDVYAVGTLCVCISMYYGKRQWFGKKMFQIKLHPELSFTYLKIVLFLLATILFVKIHDNSQVKKPLFFSVHINA